MGRAQFSIGLLSVADRMWNSVVNVGLTPTPALIPDGMMES